MLYLIHIKYNLRYFLMGNFSTFTCTPLSKENIALLHCYNYLATSYTLPFSPTFQNRLDLQDRNVSRLRCGILWDCRSAIFKRLHTYCETGHSAFSTFRLIFWYQPESIWYFKFLVMLTLYEPPALAVNVVCEWLNLNKTVTAKL